MKYRLLIVFVFITKMLFGQQETPPIPPIQSDSNLLTEKGDDILPETEIVAPFTKAPTPIENLASYFNQSLNFSKEKWTLLSGKKVFLRMDIDSNGLVKDVSILKGIEDCKSCRAKILSLAKTTTWQPGEYNGKPIRVKVNIPVVFKSN